MKFETFAIPFETRGNRQVLTDMQLAEMPFLMDFISSFPRCFERDYLFQWWIFYPEGDAQIMRQNH